MEKEESKRNMVRQVIINKDGTEKVIWHEKKFNQQRYLNYRNFWHQQNTMPKPNSKRQKNLREQKLTVA